MRMRKRKVFKRVLLCVFLMFFLLLGAGIYFLYPVYVKTQKQVFSIVSDMDAGTFRRDGNTYVFDADKKKIGKIGNENYAYKKSSDISPYIKNGYIAQEDKNFASHPGVDVKALIRAGLAYVKNRGVAKQGGSTITQQVVKNNLLSQERIFDRKFTELFISLDLEKMYSKTQIMEFYCNSNYYGNGCYGVEGAAQYYFGKSAKDVTLAEAAMIVGTSNRPNDYNPADSYENATRKKESVLMHMQEQGYITKKEYEQAMSENPVVVEKVDKTDADNYMVSYAIHCATLKLMKMQGFDFVYHFDSQKQYKKYQDEYKAKYKECAKNIRTGGYKIFTSFDQDIQKKLQKSVTKALKKNAPLEGAAVCMDNRTQMVAAIVGGRSKKDEYNRAFLAARNPGSSIKPLLDYGPALNEGVVAAGSYMEDEPVDYSGYRPKNANGTYLGMVTVREALARSINTIAVKLFHETGNKKCLSYLDDMEFSSLCYADSTITSIALGGMTYGVKPVDMARGYCTIANGGKYSSNDCIVRMEREDGSVVYQKSDKTKAVYTADTAYILSDMMQGVFREEYGTAYRFYKKGAIYAGKTGTTNDNKDAWFCGFSSSYTVCVWAGCDMPKEVEGLTGGTLPASVFMDFMEKMPGGDLDFTVPETVYLSDRNGVVKPLPSGADLYLLRPDGYDYASKLNDAKRVAFLLSKRIEAEKAEAEKEVSDFEEYTIRNTKQAKNIEEKYNDVLSVIGQIEDNSAQAEYKNRAAYQYGLLQRCVNEKWKDVIKAEKDAKRKKRRLNQDKEAAASEDLAVETLENKKRDVVLWYEAALYGRKVYGEFTKKMITDAKNALAEYEGCSDYENVSTRISQAIAYAMSLPSPEEVKQETEIISLPDADDYPEDAAEY